MRIGLDIGGTKIAAILLAPDGSVAGKRHALMPGDYSLFLNEIKDIVEELDRAAGARCSVGVGFPGVVDHRQGVVGVCKVAYLTHRPVAADLAAALGRPVKIANDAECFVMSEAADGAGASYSHVFGVIMGTGAGGVQAVDRKLVLGPHGIGGGWGHVPLPFHAPEDGPVLQCFCGLKGCTEMFVSGPGLARLHRHCTGEELLPPLVVERAVAGDPAARATLDHFYELAAKGFSTILHLIDPDVIVIGGGLCTLPGLCEAIKARLPRYSYVKEIKTAILPALYGADSGVRGAAWL
ncbi:MAG: ROK family protein [Alphaproteobacteria bacterium]